MNSFAHSALQKVSTKTGQAQLKGLMDRDAAMASIATAVREMVLEPGTVTHLQRGQVERTITASLANKLKTVFERDGITVDPFYNKHYAAAKKLNGRIIELDIAIHEQGVDARNLVAIELETTNNPKRDDVWKLEGLTQPLGGYGYKLGLFLVFGVKDKAGQVLAQDWFVEGKRV